MVMRSQVAATSTTPGSGQIVSFSGIISPGTTMSLTCNYLGPFSLEKTIEVYSTGSVSAHICDTALTIFTTSISGLTKTLHVGQLSRISRRTVTVLFTRPRRVPCPSVRRPEFNRSLMTTSSVEIEANNSVRSGMLFRLYSRML